MESDTSFLQIVRRAEIVFFDIFPFQADSKNYIKTRKFARIFCGEAWFHSDHIFLVHAIQVEYHLKAAIVRGVQLKISKWWCNHFGWNHEKTTAENSDDDDRYKQKLFPILMHIFSIIGFFVATWQLAWGCVHIFSILIRTCFHMMITILFLLSLVRIHAVK